MEHSVVATARRPLHMLLAAGLAVAAGAIPAFGNDDPRIAAARAASKDLGDTLKGQLTAAIAAGGPASAIDVCKVIASQLAGEISQKSGMSIRRTALRVRNPVNAPDPFERKVLEDFLKEIAQGADPAKLEHAEIVTEKDRKVFRYMKAIPTAATPCLTCHGSEIAPDVRQAIRANYTSDQATGFKAGDLRGAFSVIQDIR